MAVDADIRSLCSQIKNLSETVSWLLDKHEQLNTELLVCKKVNKHLEEKVAKLEKGSGHVWAVEPEEQYWTGKNSELD